MRSARLAGLLVLLPLGLALATGAMQAKHSSYTDAVYNFKLDPPSFPPAADGSSITAATFLAPPDKDFAANVNVMVQKVAMTRDQYAELTRSQFKSAGLKVNSEKALSVSGKEAMLWDYEGSMQNRELRFLSLAVADKAQVYLVTCTALKAEFPKYEKEFHACVDSFTLTK